MSKEKIEKVKEIVDKLPISPLEKQIALMTTAIGGNPTKFLVECISNAETKKAEKENPKQPFPEDYTETEKAIAEMLTENTGAHILDSGGIYGRHWEKNRKIKDFRKLPRVKVTVWNDREIDISINVFHYLTAFLEIDETAKWLQKLFDEFEKRPEYAKMSWLGVMEEFAEYIEENYPEFEYAGTWNTYNWENLLSQVLQGVTLHKGDEYNAYWILQIHNGCDVRGGYTKPRIFHVIDRDYALMGMDSIQACCECTHLYSDDCGYHWYGEKENVDNTLPEYWKPKPKKPNAKNWEYKLVCEKCGKEVEFFANLDI